LISLSKFLNFDIIADDYADFGGGSDGDIDANDMIDGDYGDDGDGGDQNDDAELENAFLEAKGPLRVLCLLDFIYILLDSYGDGTDKNKVAKAFEGVLVLETKQGEKGEWGFRACKWLVRVNHQLGKHDLVKKYFLQMLKDYKDLLAEKEKALKKLLEGLEDSPEAPELFRQTLTTLDKAGNKKAALRLELIQARVLAKQVCLLPFLFLLHVAYFVLQGKWEELSPVLERLHDSCRTPDGSDDASKGSQLLEIYALKIQLENERKNNSRLKELYTKALAINGLV
jgi:hypothetical protein